MVRPVMPKLNPAPKVDPKANAAHIAQLEAQATQLREQIRLANKMGEREWATTARKELEQVTSKLDGLQQPAAQPVNGSLPANGGAPSVQPALFTQPTTLSFAPVKLDTGAPKKDPAADTIAHSIIDDVTKGKSIDKIASERGMTSEQVLAAIRAGNNLEVTVTDPTGKNGDVQTTVIKDTSDPKNRKTVTLYYDYQHDTYYAVMQDGSAAPTETPLRDGLGRKQTSSYDSETGAITTRYEDDLGSGTKTERTSMPNGASVETVTPNGGPALPVTTVTGPDGKKTVLAPTQDPGGASTKGIQDDLAAGKSIDQIAKDRGLSREQVIAELQGAGYEVKTGDPNSDNGDVQSVELVDPHTGDKTAYYYDYQHDTRSVVTTKGDTETTVSEDGNGKTTNTARNTKTGEATTTIVDPKAGTEIKIVTDKDGRITKTTTEKINDGKPIDYEVKAGDNLTLIAQQHGVTLDELRKTNPELFDNPRDPNLIRPGEKVRIENGTRTTVEVTANGYTLTTDPDGKVTLHNNTTGTTLDIKVGTAQEGLATLLVSINPASKDPETAKADTVLKTTLEGILGGASPELFQEVTNKQQAVKDAIVKYGGGISATPQLDGSATTVGPFGNPPTEPTKSGGAWVPLMVNGNWQWFDPEVAKAIAAENAAIARLGEAQARPIQSQAQLDVYALDPAYKDAMNAAKSTLDKALAPYGLEWKVPTPKGTLAEAQERLTLANNALEKATTARVEYTQGEKDLLAAIGKQATLPAINDPSQPAAGQSGGPSSMEINLDAKAKHSEVNNLFIQSSLHTANGNKATVDQMVSATELELKLTDAKPGSPEHTALTERLDGLKTLQKAAGNQVSLAEAYAEYGVAQKDALDLAARVEPIKQQIIAQARERNPHHFDEKGYTNAEGDFTGKLLKQEFIEENGQLYMVNTYENDNFLDENNNDTNVLKVQLTYNLNDENIRDDFRNNSLNKQWQEVLSSTRSTPTSAPVCTPGGTGSVSALEAAKAKIIGTQVDQLDAGLKDAKTKLINADTALQKAITDHGGGTIEAPAGTLKPGEQPVKITFNGRDLWVAPEVAEAYGKQGPSAIGDSGNAVQIEMNGQKLWVHPEVAAAEIDRGKAEDEKNQLEKWQTESRPAMVAARDWYSFSAGHPKLLDDAGMAERESKLKNEYFQEHRDKALAGYQVQFENLYDKGFTGEYKQYKPDELTGAVAKTLGLDPSSEGVEKITEEIHDRAGDDAQVKIVPIFSLDGGMESMTALFAIKDGGGKDVGYVDTSGKYYSSFDEFQHENRIFSDKGKLVMAKGGDMSLGKDGKFTLDELEVADGRKVDFWDKATDIGLGIVAGAATIVSFVPGGQWAIPIALASGAALGGKTLYKEGEHLLQGGEFDGQSAWNVATGVVSFLPVGAGSLRTIGLAKSGTSLTTFQAFKGGFGMTRMADASWGIGKFKVNVSQSSYAGEVSNFMQSGSKLNTAAWGLDAAGLATGVPILMRSAEDLLLHGGEMSFAELANAIIGIGTGAVGTGLGARGLLYSMPGASGPRGGDGPSSSDTPPTGSPPPLPAGEAGPGPQPRHVYEAGPDGVYRPTGKYVIPDPNEVVIQGEVISGGAPRHGSQHGSTGSPDGSKPTGSRESPAGDAQGGGTSPTGDGYPSSRPAVRRANGDGADHPAPVVISTSPSRAIEGPSSDIHGDGAPTPGERGDPEGVSDSRGREVREQNTQPADSDPIVVPQTKSGVINDPLNGPLIWDPVNKRFTGTQSLPDTSAYTYSSGKDQLQSYSDGIRPSDPAVPVAPGEVLVQPETEPGGRLIRETGERQGISGAKPQASETSNTPPLMRYTVGNRQSGQVLVDFNLPAGSRVVAVPEPKAIGPAPKPTPEPLEITDGRPVLFLGAEDGRWSTDPAARTKPVEMNEGAHPRSVRDDGTPIIDSFSSNPYSLGQTYKALKAGFRRAGTRYLGLGPRYDYPKLGELVDSIYHRPVPKDGFKAGQKIYVEVDGEYMSATVVIAGPQANSTRGPAEPGVHATESGYLGAGSTVERAKRGSITTPNGQLRVNTPAEEVHTYKAKDNPEVGNRSALGETLAETMPKHPDDASVPAPAWTSEQAKLVSDYLKSLERSSDPVVRDAVTRTRVQLGGEGGMPRAGSDMTPAQYHSLIELLAADKQSVFTGSKPEGTLSANGLTTLQVFSAQGKMPVGPTAVSQKLGLADGEPSLTAGALPGEARWTEAGRSMVGDYLKATASSSDRTLVAAANAATPQFKGRATKPGKAVTPEQQAALMTVLEADKGSTWVYGPKLQPDSAYSAPGKLSPEGRYNEQVLSGHETWTPYLWRQMRKYAANQQKSADPAVQALAHSLENALPGGKPKAGTEINSEVPVLLRQLLEADKASSWRAPTFFTDAQGVWRADRATVSWYMQEHEANVWLGSKLDGAAGNAIGLGGSMLGVKVPLPSKQIYGELSLKNNGPDGTGFLLPVHPNDTLGQEIFVQGYRPNLAHDESAGWIASSPMLSKNTYQSESALGVTFSIAGFSVSASYIKRSLLYLGGEGGRPGYTYREAGPLSKRAAEFWEEAARGGGSHYSSEGKVPGFEDRLLFRNFDVLPPFGGGKEPWRSSPAFEGVPRETGAGPLNRLNRNDGGIGFAVGFNSVPLTTVELGTVSKAVMPHERTARAHPDSSEGAQKVFNALAESDGRLTPDVLQHLDTYLQEVLASPNADLRNAGLRVLLVVPELGMAPPLDPYATSAGRPEGMNSAAWKAVRQELDQQARGELTPTQAHYLNQLLGQDVLNNAPPPDGTQPALPQGPDGPVPQAPEGLAPPPGHLALSEGSNPAQPEGSASPKPETEDGAAADSEQPASNGGPANREGGRSRGTMELRDRDGQVIVAVMLGTEPRSPEQVYIPPVDGARLAADAPETRGKTHILYYDSNSGEPVVLPWIRGGSEDHVPGDVGKLDGETVPREGMTVGKEVDSAPVRKALEAAPPTTHSLQQVRNMRQPEKWKAGEIYTRELNGSLGEVHFPVAANPNGPHPVTGEGGRYVDAPVFKRQGDIEAIEVKTYHRWITVDGTAQAREVPLSAKLQEQINKDVALRNDNPGYQPRWVFLDAPPSPELQRALDDAAIIGNIFGHKNTAPVKSSRTMELMDKDGEVIVAVMLGSEPRSPEKVYVPPADGPRAAADAPETADKTHILIYDPQSGEPFVLPWIRGASEDHVPGSLGRSDEGSQPTEPVGDPTRAMRGNVGPYVFRADTRPPSEIQAVQGFSPQAPTGIWVGDTLGITLSNYVLGNTYGRFVGASQSISGVKSFVADVSRAAHEQGYTYVYVLNPSRPRLHVPTEFEAMGRPVDDLMARVDETAVDGSVPWSEVYGWRMMDPDGNFIGEFTPNPDFVDPSTLATKRPQIILRTADEFWDAGSQTETATTPVTNVAANEPAVVTGETYVVAPVVANVDTPPSASWPPAPDHGRAIIDAASGRIVGLELPPSFAAEPGGTQPVRAPIGKEVNALSPEQISGLTGAQLHAIKPEHIGKLTPEQVAALTPEQIGQLTFDQLAALKPKQLRALSAEQLQAIRPSKLEAIAPGRMTAFTPEQLAAFSPEQLAALSKEQVRKLTPDQIAALSDEQRNAFTAEQFEAFRPAQFGKLTPTEVAAFKPDLVAARNPATTAKMSPDHISALTREQLGALTIEQIEALTKQQVQALTPKQLGELSSGQLRKFRPAQFAWMTTEQTNAMSVVQLTTYRATHKNAMTPDQAAAVDAALAHARIVENTQMLATFGPMAGATYTVWQMLPPQMATTASGIAFTIRGVVFTTQSLFPNATANHKPLGRALNAASGASQILSMPGGAAATFQGTGPATNFIANSTYTLGNAIFGPKSLLQAFTGRPVFRTAADHVGNAAFLVGSGAYTVYAWDSPLAASAGVLFTVGSAEFWASAVRADRVNSKSVPRTDDEIKAREKSDKRWGMADRLALGITFGVGMLMFAWDTLDEQLLGSTDKAPPADPIKPDDKSGVDGTSPSDGTDKPDPKTEEQPQTFPQLVVLADDGLNLRSDPDGTATVVTVLQPGSFVEQTDKPSTDSSGKIWIPVEGYGPDGKPHTGWVSADLVKAHADGASNPDGRTNPKLEQNGYRWVEVKNGDSIRLIATANAADVADTVVLNMDHILSPDVIFAGDRIYLPTVAVG